MESPGVSVVNVDAPALSAFLRALRVAIPREDFRPILKAALVDPQERWCASTNGHHVVRTALPGPLFGLPVVVALDGVAALITALGSDPHGTVAWQNDSRWLVCRYGPVEVATALLDGRYPDIRRVIPDVYSAEAIVEGRPLADGLTAVSRAIRDVRGAEMSVIWRPDGLEVMGHADATISRFVPGTGTVPAGASVCARFAPTDLHHLGQALQPGPVRWQYSQPESPARIIQGRIEHIVLPLREYPR